jgi:hypothetical protein
MAAEQPSALPILLLARAPCSSDPWTRAPASPSPRRACPPSLLTCRDSSSAGNPNPLPWTPSAARPSLSMVGLPCRSFPRCPFFSPPWPRSLCSSHGEHPLGKPLFPCSMPTPPVPPLSTGALPKIASSSAPYISHEKQQAPPRPGVLAAQLGLASSLSGHPSRCSTARTTCSTICATCCVWSCWCSAQRLRDATDLRSAYESSSKPAVSSLLPRAFCVRLKGRTNESHNKLCNDCVCRLIATLVDVTPCASLVGKVPKLMACMRGTSRPGCSPCMIAIYFNYVFGR